MACGRELVAGPGDAQRRLARHRAGQSGPRVGLPAVSRRADGGTGRTRRLAGGALPHRARSASSATATSLRSARTTRESCSTGRGSRRYACVRRYPPPLLPFPTRCGPRWRWHGSAILARRRVRRCSPCCGPSSAGGGRRAAMASSIPPPWVSCSPSSACRTRAPRLPRRRLQAAGWPLPPRGGGGKSGLHGNTVPGNARRGRPQGKCHREQTARRGRLRSACG